MALWDDNLKLLLLLHIDNMLIINNTIYGKYINIFVKVRKKTQEIVFIKYLLSKIPRNQNYFFIFLCFLRSK